MPGKQEPTDRRRICPWGLSPQTAVTFSGWGDFAAERSESSIPRKEPSAPSGPPGQVVSEPTYYISSQDSDRLGGGEFHPGSCSRL